MLTTHHTDRRVRKFGAGLAADLSSYRAKGRHAMERAFYTFGRRAIGALSSAMLDMDVAWHSPMPQGAKIIAANHPSTSDPALVMTLAREHTSVLISETLFKIPVLGAYLRRAGHVPVIHGSGRSALQEGIRLLKAGRTIMIFPEGALSPLEGGVYPAHTGAARLALATGAPIVPIGIGIRPEHIRYVTTDAGGETEIGRLYLNGPYAMTVGEAMHLTGSVEDRPHVRAVSERIIERIADLAHESVMRIAQREQMTNRSRGIAPLLARLRAATTNS